MMAFSSNKVLFFIALLVYALLFACGGTQKVRTMPARDRLEPMKLLEKKKNLRASTEFKILVLNNPGSSFVDTAQFYLAESFFNMKEYITAAAEYEKLLRVYPRSNFTDNAQYKMGFAYYKLSPRASLDQEYTTKAIDAFEQFLDEYPESELVDDATQKLLDANTKLAKKEFDTGEHYRRAGYWRAAINSYDDVVKYFKFTRFAEDAYYWRAYCLLKLEEYDEARGTIRYFLAQFPETSYLGRAKSLANQIENAAKKAQLETTANGIKN